MVLLKQLVNQIQLKQLQFSPSYMQEKETGTHCDEKSIKQDNPKLLFIHVEGIWYYYILSLVIVWLDEYTEDVLM